MFNNDAEKQAYDAAITEPLRESLSTKDAEIKGLRKALADIDKVAYEAKEENASSPLAKRVWYIAHHALQDSDLVSECGLLKDSENEDLTEPLRRRVEVYEKALRLIKARCEDTSWKENWYRSREVIYPIARAALATPGADREERQRKGKGVHEAGCNAESGSCMCTCSHRLGPTPPQPDLREQARPALEAAAEMAEGLGQAQESSVSAQIEGWNAACAYIASELRREDEPLTNRIAELRRLAADGGEGNG